MKVGVILGAVGLFVLLVAAAAFYMLAMPDRLAGDYRDDAEPAQQEIRKAMKPVYRSLSVKTFYANDKHIARAKDPDQFVREIDIVTSTGLRRIEPVQRKVDRAQRALEDADEEALTETPDWPLLGGRGKLDDAEAIAGVEKEYMSQARAFLKRYEPLLKFWKADLLAVRRFGVSLGRGFDSIPDNPGSPSAVSKPLDKMARDLSKQARNYRRIKAPPGLRRYRREAAALVNLFAREIERLSSAVKNLNLAQIEEFDRRISRGLKKSDAEVSITRLVKSSNYARDVTELKTLEREIQRKMRGL